MLSDIEIARQATPLPVARIAEKLGYSADELPPLSAKARPPSASGSPTGCAGWG